MHLVAVSKRLYFTICAIYMITVKDEINNFLRGKIKGKRHSALSSVSSWGWKKDRSTDNVAEIAGRPRHCGWRLRMLTRTAGRRGTLQVFANAARSSRGIGVCYSLRWHSECAVLIRIYVSVYAAGDSSRARSRIRRLHSWHSSGKRRPLSLSCIPSPPRSASLSFTIFHLSQPTYCWYTTYFGMPTSLLFPVHKERTDDKQVIASISK